MTCCIVAKLFSVKRTRWSLFIMISSLFAVDIIPFCTGKTVDEAEKCFPFIGCYKCPPPSGRNFPQSVICNLPGHLRIKYLLFTPFHLNESVILDYDTANANQTIASSPIVPDLHLKILIAGFSDDLPKDSEFFKIKDELFKYRNYNVIAVDWSDHNNFPYTQAVANAKQVGRLVAKLVQLIHWNKGIKYEHVHIIGHSLGAHIAGWVGQKVKGLGRITGLDPAGPYFHETPEYRRLDKGDAIFVDIIHSSAGDSIYEGLGLHQAIGDIDFYPNGGKHQPKCGKSTPLNFLKVEQCEHAISLEYFRASILECKFQAVLCKNYEEFTSGRCNYNNSAINEMGFHSKKVLYNGIDHPQFYLFTTSTYPYCTANNTPVLEDQNPSQHPTINFVVNFLSLFVPATQYAFHGASFFVDTIPSFIQNLLENAI